MEQATCKVTEFHNTEFGAIRVIEDQGRLLFCGTDVAFAEIVIGGGENDTDTTE